MAYKKKNYPKTDPTETINNEFSELAKSLMDFWNNPGGKWKAGWSKSIIPPYNAETGRVLQGGFNKLQVMAKAFETPGMLPQGFLAKLYKETDGEIHIKRGEKSTRLFVPKPIYLNVEKEKQEGEEEGKTQRVDMFVKFNLVPYFNVSQIEGPIEKFIKPVQFTPMNEVQEIEFYTKMKQALIDDGMRFVESAEGRAYYSSMEDKLHMPHMHRFDSSETYADTLAHEMVHATGHASRNNRELANAFGSEKYAFEELVAETGSIFLSMKTGRPYNPENHENHAMYVKSWMKALTDNPEDAKNFLMKAMNLGNSGANFLISRVEKIQAMEDEELEQQEQEKIAVQKGVETPKIDLTTVKPKRRMELAA
ncbi:zincin-like metallopeptidase domain-containing protein (plasmid) [Burkholderia vietnamiensis]